MLDTAAPGPRWSNLVPRFSSLNPYPLPFPSTLPSARAQKKRAAVEWGPLPSPSRRPPASGSNSASQVEPRVLVVGAAAGAEAIGSAARRAGGGRHVPGADDVVVGRGERLAAVGGEGHRADRGVGREMAEVPAGREVPDGDAVGVGLETPAAQRWPVPTRAKRPSGETARQRAAQTGGASRATRGRRFPGPRPAGRGRPPLTETARRPSGRKARPQKVAGVAGESADERAGRGVAQLDRVRPPAAATIPTASVRPSGRRRASRSRPGALGPGGLLPAGGPARRRGPRRGRRRPRRPAVGGRGQGVIRSIVGEPDRRRLRGPRHVQDAERAVVGRRDHAAALVEEASASMCRGGRRSGIGTAGRRVP